MSKFPKEFLWGASTSAFQVEGAAQLYGKGESTADTRCAKKCKQQADASVTSDHYHHMLEDVSLMKELGLKSYRFSICWARIFPNGNDEQPNEEGVRFYQELIDELNKNHIEPIVTLLHFDIPTGLNHQYGGFEARQAAFDFERYARFCFETYGDRVKFWLTINEQNIMAQSANMCGLENDDPQLRKKLAQINYHLFLANALAIKACHEVLPKAKIGPAVSYPTLYPATCDPKDVYIAKQAADLMAFSFMDMYVYGAYPKYYQNHLEAQGILPKMLEEDAQILKDGSCDYLGLNWYCTSTLKHGNPKTDEEVLMQITNLCHAIRNPYLEYTEWNWSYDPLAFRMALRECWDHYHLPIMITENGWSQVEALESDGTVHDPKRIQYLHDHIEQMGLAIEDGVCMIGYHVWSFIDLLSSSDGFRKRYGLVYVDRDEFDTKECKRYKKDSFYYYQSVISNNASDIEIK